MVNDIKEAAKKRMDGVIDQLNSNLSQVRTGRANAMILDRVKAEYYGTLTPVNQMAAIKTPDAHTLVIEPWDKSALGAIEQAIMKSDLGVSPNNDGSVIRLPFPQLTEERRKELAKQCKEFAEEARIAVRNARRDANQSIDKMVKDDNLPEDEKRRAEEEIQKLTDSYIGNIDDILKKKESEVMSI
jgi:ribosome recycling factor